MTVVKWTARRETVSAHVLGIPAAGPADLELLVVAACASIAAMIRGDFSPWRCWTKLPRLSDPGGGGLDDLRGQMSPKVVHSSPDLPRLSYGTLAVLSSTAMG